MSCAVRLVKRVALEHRRDNAKSTLRQVPRPRRRVVAHLATPPRYTRVLVDGACLLSQISDLKP